MICIHKEDKHTTFALSQSSKSDNQGEVTEQEPFALYKE